MFVGKGLESDFRSGKQLKSHSIVQVGLTLSRQRIQNERCRKSMEKLFKWLTSQTGLIWKEDTTSLYEIQVKIFNKYNMIKATKAYEVIENKQI